MNTSEMVGSVGMDRFWDEYPWLLSAKGDISCALLHSGRNSTVLHTKLSACNHEISQAKERVKPCRAFWQAHGSEPYSNPIVKPLEAKCLISTRSVPFSKAYRSER